MLEESDNKPVLSAREKVKKFFHEGKSFEDVKKALMGEVKVDTLYSYWSECEKDQMCGNIQEKTNPLMSTILAHDKQIKHLEAVQESVEAKVDEILNRVQNINIIPDVTVEKMIPVDFPESFYNMVEEGAKNDEVSNGDIVLYLRNVFKGLPLREKIQSIFDKRGRVLLRLNSEGKIVVAKDIGGVHLLIGIVLGAVLSFLVLQAI